MYGLVLNKNLRGLKHEHEHEHEHEHDVNARLCDLQQYITTLQGIFHAELTI